VNTAIRPPPVAWDVTPPTETPPKITWPIVVALEAGGPRLIRDRDDREQGTPSSTPSGGERRQGGHSNNQCERLAPM